MGTRGEGNYRSAFSLRIWLHLWGASQLFSPQSAISCKQHLTGLYSCPEDCFGGECEELHLNVLIFANRLFRIPPLGFPVQRPTEPSLSQRTIFLGQLEGDRIIQDKALVIPFEESEASLPTMTTKVKEALAMGADENIILTDSQGNLLLDTPGTKGSASWKQSSRRLFAIKEDVFAEMGRRKRREPG
ncbi:hypothetical protein G5714_004386 [Onychostoma macrolepis]|uniref:Uncharacterized protein n=1 Tax=Onychostoma macrolepis TaxID=369639 RepID=A0A7J6D4J4_9TELE|nr:hypothetical protein G5714_004386 [Onychostoma macrolepis]